MTVLMLSLTAMVANRQERCGFSVSRPWASGERVCFDRKALGQRF